MTQNTKKTKLEAYVAPNSEIYSLTARQALLQVSNLDYGNVGAAGQDSNYNDYGEDF